MANRLQKTVQVLARSRNRAVLPLLAAGLQSNSPQIRAAAIRATLQRVDLQSHIQLIRHFPKLGEAEQAVLSDVYRQMPHHAAPALKMALLGGDAKLRDNACQMILLCEDFNSLPALLKAAEKHQQHANQIAGSILQLAERLHDRLTAWAAGERSQADPTFARHPMLAALTRALEHAKHIQSEIIEAYLLLAPSEDATLLGILRDSHHAWHARLVSVFSSCKRRSTFERLVALLSDTDVPTAALEALASRIDQPFVEFLLQSLRHPVPLRVLHNMKRLRSVAWLESHREMLLDFDGRSQAIAVELAAASTMERSAFFDVLVLLVREGLAEGRRAACSALAKFEEPLADMLVLAALEDPDAGVQAAAARQLRPRRLPEALKTLVSLLDSPSVEVRDAARSSLAEFNFVRYRAMFDHLDENAARTTGALVHKVDHTAIAGLIAELALPAVSSRLRAIEMAIAMQATQDVLEPLVELSHHENASIRREALVALRDCTGPKVLDVLTHAAGDPNGSIAEAARQSLARCRERAAGVGSEQAASLGNQA